MVLWSCSRDFSPITRNNNSPPDENKPSIIVGEPVKIVERGNSPQWSRDGKRIAYVGYSNGSDNIFITSDTGGVAFQVTQFDSTWPIWTPCWSPDDKTIAFTAIIKNAPGNGKVFSMPVTGGPVMQLTPDSLTVQGCDWSPNGTHIVFDAASTRNLSIRLWTVCFSDRTVSQLSMDWGYSGWPKFSPDGSRVAFESVKGANSTREIWYQIWTVSIDGTDPQQITTEGGEDPYWSPDGKWITFTLRRPGNRDIYVIPATGGETTRITFSENNEVRPAWSPDGKKIAYDTNVIPGELGIWIVTIDIKK